MERRHDGAMSSAINRGIDIDETKGCIAAWVFLMSIQIPHAVIERVLSQPENRRARQSPAALASEVGTE